MWLIKIFLLGIEAYPLLSLRPPLSHLDPRDRLDFLMKRFYQDVTLRLVPEFWRTIVQGMIRMGKQLSYLGYYNDKRTYASVGYVPFSEREDTPKKLADTARKLLAHELPETIPLGVQTSADITTEKVSADVAIIGSGAAASILAHGLTLASRQVLLLERDRKSTRLNSSHTVISYAVFCLKKKNTRRNV